MHTDFSELTAAAEMASVHSTLFAQRHVAWDWASTLDHVAKTIGNDVRWIADSYDGPNVWGEHSVDTMEELMAACEKGESIRAVDGNGNRLTPTIALV